VLIGRPDNAGVTRVTPGEVRGGRRGGGDEGGEGGRVGGEG